MINKLFSLALVIAMLFSTVQSKAIDSYCQAPNKLSLTGTNRANPTFDDVGTYLDDDKESIPLILTNSDGTNDYKWQVYDLDGDIDSYDNAGTP